MDLPGGIFAQIKLEQVSECMQYSIGHGARHCLVLDIDGQSSLTVRDQPASSHRRSERESQAWHNHPHLHLAGHGLPDGAHRGAGLFQTDRRAGIRVPDRVGPPDGRSRACTAAPGWIPLICLSAAAACTERIKLGTHILVLPLRHPVLLAKEIATLDYISGGRFFFGVGPGWSKPEFDAMGIDLRERGRRTDEILDACKLLLTEKHVSFKGEFFEFDDVTIDPMPPKYPEVWVAGGSRIPDALSPDKPYMVKTVMQAHRQARRRLHLPCLGETGVGQAGFRDRERFPQVGGPGPRNPGLRPRPGHLRGGHPGPGGGATASSGPTSSA